MDWSVTQRQRLHSLFGVFFGPEITGAILSLLRPAVRLTGRDEPLETSGVLTGADVPLSTGSALSAGVIGTATVAEVATRTVVTEVTHLERSRLGGAAALPADQQWPRWGTRPLDLLALIDFGELSALGRGAEGLGRAVPGRPLAPVVPPEAVLPEAVPHPAVPRPAVPYPAVPHQSDAPGASDGAGRDLPWCPGAPETGTLAVYYASTPPRPWGDLSDAEQGGWRLLAAPAAVAAPPEGAVAYPPLPLSAAPFLSLPGPGEPALGELMATYSGVSHVYEQLYAAWREHVWADQPIHQIGGWPVPVDGPVEPGGEAVLLAQFDSDERLGWHWGDPGRVYFTLLPGEPLHRARLTLQAR